MATLVAAVLVLPASALADSLMPPGFCESLPPVTDQPSLAVLAAASPRSVLRSAAGLTPAGNLRRMTPEAAVALFDEASRRGYNTIEFIADPGFMSDCRYYLDPDTLQMVDKLFVMDLATRLSGTGTDGQPFAMRLMLLGQSNVAMTYDRDGIRYFNPRAKRAVALARHVEFSVSADSSLRNIHLNAIRGMRVDTGFPFGWRDIEALRQIDRKIETFVLGAWREGMSATTITRRGVPARPLWRRPLVLLDLLNRLSAGGAVIPAR